MDCRHTTASLTRSWRRTWRALGVRRGERALMERILACYAQPQRHYHTRQHLAECLKTFEEVAAQAIRPAEIEIALWFHDAVYEVRADDNEARSALWAQQELIASGAGAHVARRVVRLILATAHRAAPATPDECLLTDIDLAILGAAPERFEEYDRQVRREYAWVSDETFYPARRRILDAFLARPHIYSSDSFQRSHEAQARRNLRDAVARLDRRLAGNPSQEG